MANTLGLSFPRQQCEYLEHVLGEIAQDSSGKIDYEICWTSGAFRGKRSAVQAKQVRLFFFFFCREFSERQQCMEDFEEMHLISVLEADGRKFATFGPRALAELLGTHDTCVCQFLVTGPVSRVFSVQLPDARVLLL